MGKCKWKPESHIYVLALSFSLPGLVTRPFFTARVEVPVVPFESIRCMEGCLLFIFAFDIGVFFSKLHQKYERLPTCGGTHRQPSCSQWNTASFHHLHKKQLKDEINCLFKQKNGVLLPRWTSVSTISTNSISGLLSCKKLLSVTVISKFANTVWAAFYTI